MDILRGHRPLKVGVFGGGVEDPLVCLRVLFKHGINLCTTFFALRRSWGRYPT